MDGETQCPEADLNGDTGEVEEAWSDGVIEEEEEMRADEFLAHLDDIEAEIECVLELVQREDSQPERGNEEREGERPQQEEREKESVVKETKRERRQPFARPSPERLPPPSLAREFR